MSMAQPGFGGATVLIGRSNDGTVDKIFERVGSPALFLRVLIEAGYRLYRVTLHGLGVESAMMGDSDRLVWAKPAVELIEWQRIPTKWQGEGWYRHPVAWQEVPKTMALPPDLDFLDIISGPKPVSMGAATTAMLDGAVLVLDPEDGGTVRELRLYS